MVAFGYKVKAKSLFVGDPTSVHFYDQAQHRYQTVEKIVSSR